MCYKSRRDDIINPTRRFIISPLRGLYCSGYVFYNNYNPSGFNTAQKIWVRHSLNQEGNFGLPWRCGLGIEWKARSAALSARTWSDSPALPASAGWATPWWSGFLTLRFFWLYFVDGHTKRTLVCSIFWGHDTSCVK